MILRQHRTLRKCGTWHHSHPRCVLRNNQVLVHVTQLLGVLRPTQCIHATDACTIKKKNKKQEPTPPKKTEKQQNKKPYRISPSRQTQTFSEAAASKAAASNARGTNPCPVHMQRQNDAITRK